MIRLKFAAVCFVTALGFLMFSASSRVQGPTPSQPSQAQQPMVYEDSPGGLRVIEEGQPPVMIHATVEEMKRFDNANGANPHAKPGQGHGAGTSNDLSYRGGIGGIGVETVPKVYLVLWGSQWNNNDPSGEATILQNFYNGVGGSSWLNSVTQYCQGVPSGTVFCNGAGTAAGNPKGILAGVWVDNTSAAPSKPRQSQLAAEAVRAAQHFGNTSAASNASVQYVIATSTGHNSSGFGRSYCAYHSSTSSAVGNVAYTNLPYMTDAGASCGANFNGLGPDAGITIVAGHEMAESITDQLPNGGWLDSGGEENGDKCAWISSGQGASADINLSTGTFAVQSLWSNAFNGGSGGCVLTYP
jgi:serine protease